MEKKEGGPNLKLSKDENKTNEKNFNNPNHSPLSNISENDENLIVVGEPISDNDSSDNNDENDQKHNQKVFFIF